MTEIEPRIFVVAKELNYADSGGIGTYEWNHYERGDRSLDTVRHVNRYVTKAEKIMAKLSNTTG